MALVELKHLGDGVAGITLNRPDALNAMNWQAMDEFAAAVGQLHERQDLWAVIVHGSGRAFCSGGDLFELHQYPEYEDGLRLATVMGDALNRLERLPCPTIAAIEGPALGGGAEIALACDLRVMAEDATLGMMHVRLAISSAWGGGQRLLRLVGYPLAFEWMTIGRILSAEEADHHGLVNRVVPSGEALAKARELAASIGKQDAGAVRAIKRILRDGLELPYEQALATERSEFPKLWAAAAHLQASEDFVARKNHRVRKA
ncbi:MAG: enoyl-CoA hydratase/isomerase family protein [Anaerolineales bacterium]